ncbi:phage tail protein [Ornithinibacillus sp. BX22]|uniref:Phage tail protein n=1 Tax=Ornithinibacillus hominis TaxID=2763055 RepID=A0A923RJA5_9BACI|nr:phage tail spike protein [Ornithinibacillus hominis]MBC5637849.1 phage tail protein [Ornithinibacillus hominis]
MTKIFIIDGQTDDFLDWINKQDVIDNIHERDMSAMLETFKFTAFADRRYSQHLTDKNRLVIPGEDGEYREFVIKLTDRYRDSDGVNLIDVTALASFQELIGAKVVSPTKTAQQSAEVHVREILAGTEIEAGNVAYKGLRAISFDNYTDPFSALKKLATEFELELDFRVEINSNRITKRYVDLVERVGGWRGRHVEFGKDLQGIRRKEDSSEIVTALLCLGPEMEDGTRLEVYVEDKEALERWGRRGQHIVSIYEPQSEGRDMTEENLIRLGKAELKKRINAIVSYEANIIDLEHITRMENKRIRFGDIVKIKDTTFNPPLFVEARIYKQNRNIFNPASKKVELGDFIEYTVEQVQNNWKAIRDEIDRKVRIAELSIHLFVEDFAEKQIPEQVIPPNPIEHPKWIDTSQSPAQLKLWDEELQEWTTIKGEKGDTGPQGPKGDQGIPGPPGEDGQTPYTHIAYANSSDGTVDFSTNNPDREYIGMYVDFNSQDSTNPSHYKWTLVKGRDGSQGVPGPPGEDGRTPYFHVAYANSADGRSGFSTTDSSNKLYIGNYTDFVKADSNDPTRYTWTKIKGDKGDKGDPGPKGDIGPQGPAGKDGIAHMGPMPPSNPAINTTWFQTNVAMTEIIAIKRWNGNTWTTSQFDADTLNIRELSAISATLGKVTGGEITGVKITGGSIESQTEIKVATDLKVGDNIFMGNGAGTKTIYFNPNTSGKVPYIQGIYSAQEELTILFLYDGNGGSIMLDSGYTNMRTTRLDISDLISNSKFSFQFKELLNHGFLESGKIGLKFLNGAVEQLQVRNANDTEYRDLAVRDLKVLGKIGTSATTNLSLLNGWENYGGSFEIAKAVKSADGIVHVSGLIKSGASGTIIARLPVGYRPSATLIFSCAHSMADSARVYVYPDGRIVLNRGGGSFVSLSGITFLAVN